MTFRTERVSIVIPFYRAGKYISEAIESVWAQEGFTNWRLYLVNDGSDDNDVEIAKEAARKHPDKVQVLEHQGRIRRGISASRNLGISQSKGDLVAFLDADDTWYPHKLRSQVSKLAAHPKAVMLYGPALRWRSWNGGVDFDVPAIVDGFGSDCFVPGPALLATFLRNEALTPCPSAVLIRREALERVGGLEEEFPGLYEDQVLYAKLCLDGSIFVSSECASRYRKHTESCCGRAEAAGDALKERARFLNWLQAWYGARHQSPALESNRRAAAASASLQG